MPAKPQRHGKAAFALLVAATLAILGWILYAYGGDQVLTGMLAQTQNRDAQGYLSEYEARMSRLTTPLETPPAQTGSEAAPAPTNAPEGIPIIAPVKPQPPQSAG